MQQDSEGGALAAEVPAVRDTSNSVAMRLAERYEVSPKDFLATVKATVLPAKTAVSNEELVSFLMVADRYQLNPLTREIYAFPKKGGGIQAIVGIDGWYSLMNRDPNFDGIEFKDVLSDDGDLVAVTARVYRKDRAHPTEATEYMVECKRNTDPWKQWPRRMLRHKAAIQAARAAFGLAGIADPDEGERIRDVTAVVSSPDAPPKGIAGVGELLDSSPPAASATDDLLFDEEPTPPTNPEHDDV